MKQLIFLLTLLMSSSIFSHGFVAGTLIKVSSGYKPIQYIKKGDLVVCYDNENSSLITKTVIDVFCKPVEKLIKIRCGNQCIYTTFDQEIDSAGYWVKATNLSPERNTLWSLKNPYLSIDNIEVINTSALVYDLSVLDKGYFFVSLHDLPMLKQVVHVVVVAMENHQKIQIIIPIITRVLKNYLVQEVQILILKVFTRTLLTIIKKALIMEKADALKMAKLH